MWASPNLATTLTFFGTTEDGSDYMVGGKISPHGLRAVLGHYLLYDAERPLNGYFLAAPTTGLPAMQVSEFETQHPKATWV